MHNEREDNWLNRKINEVRIVMNIIVYDDDMVELTINPDWSIANYEIHQVFNNIVNILVMDKILWKET